MQGKTITGGRYYTISGAAKELGKHRHTVSHWIKEEEFPVTRMGNSVMISEEVLRDMAARPDKGRRDRPPRDDSAVQGLQKISGTYYTIAGAAVELGKHRNTVARWIKEGRLPPIRLGNAILIPEEAIRDLALEADAR